jgi:DNA-directed RNA polymerase subunit RPC12/RpoP
MSDMSLPNFKCPTCGAEYEAVRIEAPPGPTTDREIVCLNCGGPLSGREGAFLFKYFLISRLRRGIVAQSSRQVLKL